MHSLVISITMEYLDDYMAGRLYGGGYSFERLYGGLP